MGRGTPWPFEVLGAPWLISGDIEFKPVNIKGKAIEPPYVNQKCTGIMLSDFAETQLKFTQRIELAWLIDMYKSFGAKESFFSSPIFFDKLAGNSSLRKDILMGKSAEEIRSSWQQGLNEYILLRGKYLLYNE
jgi:uncharacterized protein YbbC (DUF1343 family)